MGLSSSAKSVKTIRENQKSSFEFPSMKKRTKNVPNERTKKSL